MNLWRWGSGGEEQPVTMSKLLTLFELQFPLGKTYESGRITLTLRDFFFFCEDERKKMHVSVIMTTMTSATKMK